MILKFQRVLAPRHFYQFTKGLLPWLTLSFWLTLTYGLVGGLILAPPDYLQGEGFRILYVHVPCAFLSLFIYCVLGCSAFLGLVFRLKLAFLVNKHSIHLGAGFTFLALVTGSLWGKPMWGTWWIWDARLTSELLLFFIYIALLLFKSAIREKKQAEKILSILILVGLVDVPIIHYSVYWWNTLHQGSSLKISGASAIDSSMLYPLLSMITAFVLYYFCILINRIHHDLIVHQQNPHWLRPA